MPRDASELARCLADFRDVADEARSFLSLPRAESLPTPKPVRTSVPAGSPEAARRLCAMSQPIRRRLVETYSCNRGIKTVTRRTRCGFIRAAIIARTTARRQRLGRR
jgi:hypothetical protein